MGFIPNLLGLLPLGNYGGPTQTVALTSSSTGGVKLLNFALRSAIDAGNSAVVRAGLRTDQRGFPRLILLCQLGASLSVAAASNLV
jgi:hypothetical protein